MRKRAGFPSIYPCIYLINMKQDTALCATRHLQAHEGLEWVESGRGSRISGTGRMMALEGRKITCPDHSLPSNMKQENRDKGE